MGGKDAVVVDETADLDAAAAGIVASAFGFQGQKCSAGSRAIIVDQVYDQVLQKVIEKTRELTMGDVTQPDTMIGPVVDENAMKKISGYIEVGKGEGRLVTGGGQHGPGYFIEPTVIADVDPQARIAQEEIFGPVVSIIPCDNLEHAIEIANNIEYGLSSALYTKDVNRAFSAIRDLDAGITYINAPTIGAEVHLPFGGVKATGNGHREGGIGAIDFYTEWKSVYVDYSDTLQKAQIDRPD